VTEEERAAIRTCVGCGYCCKKSLCAMAVWILPPERHEEECPFLYFEGERYRCALAFHRPWAEDLCIGEGCCCSLNTERRKYEAKKGKKVCSAAQKAE